MCVYACVCVCDHPPARPHTEDNPPSVGGVVQLFKQLDPSRLVDTGSGDPSGWNTMGGHTTPGQSLAFNESGDVGRRCSAQLGRVRFGWSEDEWRERC